MCIFQAQENDVTDVQGDETATQDCAQENKYVFRPTVFVNTRRGRGHGTKRKLSDPAPATRCDPSSPQSAAEVTIAHHNI